MNISIKFLVIIFFVFVPFFAFGAEGDVLWNLSSNITFIDDKTYDIVADDNFVYIGGYSVNPNSPSTKLWTIEKYNKDTGSLVSRHVYSIIGYITSLAIDNTGIYAGGYNNGWAVYKFDINNLNTILWSQKGSDTYGKTFDISINSSYVYVTKQVSFSSTDISALNISDGTIVWTRSIGSPDGDIYVYADSAGIYVLMKGLSGWRVEKRYLTNGFLAWANNFNSSNGYPYGLTGDSSYIYTVGYDNINGDYAWRIEKINILNGNSVWVQQENINISGTYDVAYDIKVSNSSLYISGVTGNSFRIEKRDATNGGLYWSTPVTKSYALGYVRSFLDNSGLYVSGSYYNGSYFEWRRIKIDTSVLLDIGLRVFDGNQIISIAATQSYLTSPLRINKGGNTYGISLVDVSDPDASKVRVQTNLGIKALRKYAAGGSSLTVSAPTITPSGGTFNNAVSVSLSTTTSGATIYYTTDGSIPTTSSNVYTGPFMLDGGNYVVKAFAVKPGYLDSSVSSSSPFDFVVGSISMNPSGQQTGYTTVSLSTTTSGATIYYTTDGSMPTTSSNVYTGPFTLGSGDYTIRALGVKSGYSDSSIFSGNIHINLLTSSPSSYNFGRIPPNYTVTNVFRISNLSLTDIISGNVLITGNSAFTCLSGCSYSIPPGSYVDVTIGFTPIDSFSYYTANVTLDELGHHKEIFISGYGADGIIQVCSDLSTKVSANNSDIYILNGNIDCSSGLGSPAVLDNSIFDGQNYTISNLSVNSTAQFVGLFSEIRNGSEVKNLKLENINLTSSNSFGYVGAVAGRALQGTIVNNIAVISGSLSGYYTGGIVGQIGVLTFAPSIINKSYSNANINSSIGGGIVGRSYNTIISNSYATGSVFADLAGGLVAENGGDSFISNSYAVGFVSGFSSGGLVASGSNSSVTSSYWDTQTSGQTTSAGGVGKTTAEMKQQSTFVGWDFVNVWNIVNGVTYPFLR